MRYWLRRVIFEDNWERQTEELAALCKRAEIDGVLLMEQSHLILTAPYPLTKHRRMAAIYRKMGETLRAAGIRFGINIASLVGHTDMNVPQAYQLNCGRFVGDDLQEANSCYCILDESWQTYASEVCRLYAAADPEYLFIDDDFRSLNHGRTLGCFCPAHVRKTSEKLGRKVTPEEILHSLREASPQALKIRSAWIDANGEGQTAAARRLEKAVHQAYPHVMLGLMSSDEMRHSLQGRKIGETLHALAGENHQMLYRPTGAIYGDAIHGKLFEGHQRMALTMGEVNGPLHTVSELELFPHSRYGCSRRFSEIMMKTQILAGADDITLNLYDYLGNPVEREPVWEQMLHENKPFLEKLSILRKGMKLKGFGLPYRQRESRYRTWNGKAASQLYAHRSLDILLPVMGIPVCFTESQGNALTDAAIQCCTDEELTGFLSKGFLTDAKGALVLEQRGFGQYTGCHVINAGKAIPALEKILPTAYAGEFAGDLMPCRWNLFENTERFILEPFDGAETLTQLLNLEKQPLGSGTVLYRNSLGGICAVTAVSPAPDTWNFRSRAELIRRIIAKLSGDSLPFLIPDRPNLGPIYYEAENGDGLLAVLNGSLDGQSWQLAEPKIRLTERIFPEQAAEGKAPERFLEGISMEIWRTRRM